VLKIVALITVCDCVQIQTCMQIRACVPLCHVVFKWLQPYFNVCGLIFYMCEGFSEPIANQLNYGMDIFDHEGHGSLTHTVIVCIVLKYVQKRLG
jgi:hypothetical protein